MHPAIVSGIITGDVQSQKSLWKVTHPSFPLISKVAIGIIHEV